MNYDSTTANVPEHPVSSSLLHTSISHLREEYGAWQALIDAQPILVEHFLEQQAGVLADAIARHMSRTRFMLPDVVVLYLYPDGRGEIGHVPESAKVHNIGGLLDHAAHGDISRAIRRNLAELELSQQPAVSICAGLLRHVTAMYMVHQMLPSGHTVSYAAADGEEIPTVPISEDIIPRPAFTAITDAIAEEHFTDEDFEELLTPYVPEARRFYLPRWVVFDEQDRLLVGSVNEAERHIASMQRYMAILHAAVALAPYMVADPEYQARRYGMLGQLVNQARAYGRHMAQQVIRLVQERAAAHDLNRGLRISLPYFDDQALEMRNYDFVVIPAGRIQFAPAFIARACAEERAKVGQDTRLSHSTRVHLLDELAAIEKAFTH